MYESWNAIKSLRLSSFTRSISADVNTVKTKFKNELDPLEQLGYEGFGKLDVFRTAFAFQQPLFIRLKESHIVNDLSIT
jgi:hypothetical protein